MKRQGTGCGGACERSCQRSSRRNAEKQGAVNRTKRLVLSWEHRPAQTQEEEKQMSSHI